MVPGQAKLFVKQFATPCERETAACCPREAQREKRRVAVPPCRPFGWSRFRNQRAERESTLIDISLLALTRAWFATVLAVAVLLASFAIEQDWNSAVYWRGLPQAFELIGDEGPPIVDQLTGTTAARPPS